MSEHATQPAEKIHCADCRFWDNGLCRANAPQIGVEPGNATVREARWPVTRSWDWCGQAQPKAKPVTTCPWQEEDPLVNPDSGRLATVQKVESDARVTLQLDFEPGVVTRSYAEWVAQGWQAYSTIRSVGT